MTSDVIDQACDREEELRGDALRDHMRRMETWRGKTVSDSAECCQVCGDEIAQGRREAWPGVQTCIACQEELDRALKG